MYLDNDVTKILRTLASGFADLANALEKQQEETDVLINDVRAKADRNTQLLRTIGNLINGELN